MYKNFYFNVKGGGSVAGDTYEEIANMLNVQSWFAGEKNLKSFMIEVANLVKIDTGAEVDYSSPDAFIKSLIDAGYLTD